MSTPVANNHTSARPPNPHRVLRRRFAEHENSLVWLGHCAAKLVCDGFSESFVESVPLVVVEVLVAGVGLQQREEGLDGVFDGESEDVFFDFGESRAGVELGGGVVVGTVWSESSQIG
jgi:hypothetical protein